MRPISALQWQPRMTMAAPLCKAATKVSQVFPSHEKNYPPMKHYPALKLILLAVAATADVMYAFYRVKNC